MRSAIPHRPFFLIEIFFLSMPLFGGEFHGLVLDEYQEPLQDTRLYLIYPEGQHYEAVTAPDGSFFFGDLPVGEATCYLDLPDGFQTIHPVCGEMSVSISHPKGGMGKAQASGQVFFVEKIPQAIIINYGKPKSPGSSGKPKVIFPGGWSQAALGSLHHDLTVPGSKPTIIETIGRWTLPFQPGIRLQMKNPILEPPNHASTLNIDLSDLGDGRVRIRIEALLGTTIPTGKLATFTLSPGPNVAILPGPIHFCEEIMTVFKGNTLLYQNHHQLWQGQAVMDSEYQDNHKAIPIRK